MFAAAIVLKARNVSECQQTFKIPYGRVGHYFICILGLIGCVVTLLVGFIPPDGINIGSPLYYELLYCGGLLAMMLPVGLFYLQKNRQSKMELLVSEA
jgi:hypothetical protein